MTCKFELGLLTMTRNAQDTLDIESIRIAIGRHVSGDWGELGNEDRQANEQALRNRARLLSVYRDSRGTAFWIITEADRSATTVLLPDDY